MRRFDTVYQDVQIARPTIDFPNIGSNGTATVDTNVPGVALGTHIITWAPTSVATSMDDLIVTWMVVATITDQQGDDWWNAVAAEYDRLGIITGAGTYNQLRSYANSAGETVANELFGSLQQDSILNLAETLPIVNGLELEGLLAEQAQIPLDIVTIETFRDLQSDPVIIRALNDGIAALERRLEEVNSILSQTFLS